ncbi:MAG: hypothetical protein A2Y33_14430 [Spirochaetes bacterium GWF1_51_8]|nr:MAG: hypothetical protein A2Y33_14430 [Spirochaetes bacterium GWF1_51_8]
MERFRIMVFMGFLMTIMGTAHAKWDVMLRPGMGFFGDAAGYHIKVGARADVDQIFYNGIPTAQNIVFGASFFVTGAGTLTANIYQMGLGFDSGYRIEIPLQDFPRLSITPLVSFGAAYGNLTSPALGTSQKFGVFLTSALEVTLLLANPLQVGLEFGYSFFFYDSTITELNLSLVGLYTFNM